MHRWLGPLGAHAGGVNGATVSILAQKFIAVVFMGAEIELENDKAGIDSRHARH